MYPGGPQNFHNMPPRPHAHGQPPINQPVAVYGHQLEGSQPPPPLPPMQGNHQTGGLIQPPPPPAPPFGMNMISSVPVQNVNGQPNLNFAGQPVQNVGLSMKDPFNMDPAIIQQPPPPIQQQQGQQQASQNTSTTDFAKFGMPHQLYSGKIADMPPDISLGSGGSNQGVQTMLLPSVSVAQNMITLEGGGGIRGQHPVRPGLIHPNSNPPDNILGMHLSQFGGLSASQVENMKESGSFPASAGGMAKFPPGSNMEGFTFHQLAMESPNSLSSGSLSSGTVVTPSTSYIVMAPGVFSTSNENVNPNISSFSSARVGGPVGNVVPIGTERAQKSATLSAFPIGSGMCAHL